MKHRGEIREVSNGDVAFGLNLMQHLEEGNIVMSPYSIRTALGMLYEGAKGKSATELSDALKLPIEKAMRHTGFKELISAINATRQDYVLKTANGTWVDKTFAINPEFQDIATKVYSAEASNADFLNNAEHWKKSINKWVGDKTEQKIPELFKGKSINRDTVLVLANALYFKALWESKFNPKLTKKQDYVLADGTTIQVDMMRKGEIEGRDLPKFRYGEYDGVQAVILPYKGMELEKLVLLPPKGTGTKELEAHLRENTSVLPEWFLYMQETKFDRLEMPKHEARKNYNLIPAFKALGIKSIFDPEKADLSGLGHDKFGNPIIVGTAVHEAYIKNNEEGSEGAAATGVGVVRYAGFIPSKPPIKFTADHPYLELIMHRLTGSVLFINRIIDPR
ncbi:MAG TPA: serpin family protein [Candidatus Nanoarchaeia archaeon]|nr:serpin family protein [Candidatus Nanoarchaeia archaeon]